MHSPCVSSFDGNFNTNVSKTICCDRLSPTVNSRAFNPGRDLNSGMLTHSQFSLLQATQFVAIPTLFYLIVLFGEVKIYRVALLESVRKANPVEVKWGNIKYINK